MTAMRILIVDDEPLVRAGVRDALAPEADVEIVGEAANGLEAVDQIRRLRPDLVLLDIQMPGLDGFGVLRELAGEVLPVVVFVTAYDTYAVRAFEESAVDYVLKPFLPERLRAAVRRARERMQREGGDALAEHIARAVQGLGQRRAYPERLVAASAGRVRVVPLEEVAWIEAAENYVHLNGPAGRPLLRATLKSLEQQLDPARFVRVHRSAMLNLAFVREVVLLGTGEYAALLSDGSRVPVGHTYRDELVRRLSAPAG